MIDKQSGLLKVDTFSERKKSNYQANYLIKTKYVGKGENLAGTKGEAYFDNSSNMWFYRPKGSDAFFRVFEYNLECNIDFDEKTGYFSNAVYTGPNKLFKGLSGEVFVEVNDGVYEWRFRTKIDDSIEVLRVNPENLQF